MTTLPRLLVLMGSGETSPTMVKTHRELLTRIGTDAPAVLLDTPFGFQANADDLTAKAQAYFAESVGRDLSLVSFKSAADLGSVGYESSLTRLRSAGYVFAGPGSPTYALRQWHDSAIPAVLRSKLVDGGCVTFASAAALTMGVSTVPVYEIYKVGAAPEWAEGLDLLAETGLSAAVIPHYNNAEGGNHDTRFCYLGEHRLVVMEQALPDEAFVLGIDEHTGVVFDLDARTATVVGLGVLTIRVDGRSQTFSTGSVLNVDEIAGTVRKLRAGENGAALGDGADGVAASGAGRGAVATDGTSDDGPTAAAAGTLAAEIPAREAEFNAALEARDVAAAAQAMLDLESTIHDWSSDTLQSDDLDRARAALRSMIARLAALAEGGAADPRDLVGPFIEALLDLRRQARADKRYADSDAVRDHLVRLGVEVRDTAEGTEWDLSG